MVALVGASGWSEVKSWPVGTQAGHLAVLVGGPTLAGWFPAPVPGWSWVGWAFGPSSWLSTAAAVPVWWKTVTAADLSSPPPDAFGQLAVYSESPRVLTAVSGSTANPPAGGGVVAVATSPLLISGGGVTWLTEHSSVLGRVRQGWADSPAGEPVTVGAVGRPLMLVLAKPDAPRAPVITAPETGDVSATAALRVAWQHRASISGGSQSHYVLEVTTAAHGARWWDGSAWAGAEVWVASSAQETQIPAAQLVALDVHSIVVRTREALDGRDSPRSEAVAVTPVTPPSMTLTGPPSPVVDDLSPTVTWTRTTPRGVQTAFRIQWVDTAGKVVADSGVVRSTATSWTAPATTPWVRGASYEVRGWVWQTGGSQSAVATRTVVMTWTPPPTPVVAPMPQDRGVDVWVHGLVPGAPIVLQRELPAGEWVDILQTAARAETMLVTDVWAEYGESVRWRCWQSSELEGMVMRSDIATSDYFVSRDRRPYIADASDPLRTWVEVSIRSDEERVERQNRVVSYGLGDKYATVWSDPAQGMSGSAVLVTDTAEQRQALRGLLSSAGTLCWREPVEDEWLGTIDHPPTLWVAVTSAWAQQRHTQMRIPMRNIPISWVEQPVKRLGTTYAPITHEPAWRGEDGTWLD